MTGWSYSATSGPKHLKSHSEQSSNTDETQDYSITNTKLVWFGSCYKKYTQRAQWDQGGKLQQAS